MIKPSINAKYILECERTTDGRTEAVHFLIETQYQKSLAATER